MLVSQLVQEHDKLSEARKALQRTRCELYSVECQLRQQLQTLEDNLIGVKAAQLRKALEPLQIAGAQAEHDLVEDKLVGIIENAVGDVSLGIIYQDLRALITRTEQLHDNTACTLDTMDMRLQSIDKEINEMERC